MIRKLLAATVSAAVLVPVATADAATYPKPVKKAFVKECAAAASQEGVSKAKAKTYCKSAISCIEDELTLKQFKRIAKAGKVQTNKTVLGCIKEAGEEASGATEAQPA